MADEIGTYYFRAENETDTGKLAAKLAECLEPGAVVALDGDLGAGKTRFSQALAREVGVAELVSSPTFTLIKEYRGADWPFYHMDMYRLELEEAGELGLEEYFYGEGVTVVEWASRIGELLPARRLDIFIEHLGGSERLFRIKPWGTPYMEWCGQLLQTGEVTV
ncbi:MAG TPA: tRNA (adenosine(37)-N6)-threonylcarbamoyltransferase complex ATPase subunit type 1 TsaE [Bacilli bacterium]